MPSPVGHALGGAITALALLPHRRAERYLNDIAICAIAACLPDIDFLWGRHAMETHSIGAALVAGTVALAFFRRRDLAIAVVIAWLSHVLFDWLGSDDFPPLGVMALWPLSSEFYFAHAYVFDAISRRYLLPGFWAHNIRAVLKEIAILLPPLAALWVWRARRVVA